MTYWRKGEWKTNVYWIFNRSDQNIFYPKPIKCIYLANNYEQNVMLQNWLITLKSKQYYKFIYRYTSNRLTSLKSMYLNLVLQIKIDLKTISNNCKAIFKDCIKQNRSQTQTRIRTHALERAHIHTHAARTRARAHARTER